MKSAYIKPIGAILSLMLITGSVVGQGNSPNNSLASQVAALQAAVSALQATVTAQQSTIGALKTSNDELRSRLQYVSLVGQDMYITGANLHIVSGSGATAGNLNGGLPTVNGLGNLIVGYNETIPFKGTPNRSGSHNIVVGPYHSYSSFGGLVAGVNNTISGEFSSVTGGEGNTASYQSCSVSGGVGNIASGQSASVSGGSGNTASGDISSVGGGASNNAGSAYSTVSGGEFLTLEGNDGAWAGGSYHTP
jgi:hypothetical protein